MGCATAFPPPLLSTVGGFRHLLLLLLFCYGCVKPSHKNPVTGPPTRRLGPNSNSLSFQINSAHPTLDFLLLIYIYCKRQIGLSPRIVLVMGAPHPESMSAMPALEFKASGLGSAPTPTPRSYISFDTVVPHSLAHPLGSKVNHNFGCLSQTVSSAP